MKSYSKDKTTKRFLQATRKELERFFGIKIDKPLVYLIDSRKEIDRIWGKRTERWLTAWANEKYLTISKIKPSVVKNVCRFTFLPISVL